MSFDIPADFLKFTLPVLGAAIAWLVNQWQQRAREDYLRKEKLYRDLLDSIQGFYETRANTVPTSTIFPVTVGQGPGKQEFLNQVCLAWLYSPDEVIRSAYIFLATVKDRQPPTPQEEKQQALGNVVAAVRRDLFRPRFFFWQRTKLTGAQYEHLTPN